MSEITQMGKGLSLEQIGITLVPQEPSNRWVDQKTILAGPPKVGKSTFLAQAGKSIYFLRLAREFNNIQTYGVDCRDLDELRREVEKLHKVHQSGIWGSEQFPVESLAFDPGDKLLQFISDKVCDDAKADSIYEAGGYGVGQNKYKRILKSFLSDIEPLPAHKFFCFHTKYQELSEPNNETKKYHRWILDISEKMDAEFPKRVDNTLNIMVGYVGAMQARTMITQGTKYIEAGAKAPALKKVTQIAWGVDDGENYKKFRALFT
jgi:hypothetical protein